jgi:hypothetical protein
MTIRIFAKATPISDWQLVTTVTTYAEANRIENTLAYKGYYTKREIEGEEEG